MKVPPHGPEHGGVWWPWVPCLPPPNDLNVEDYTHWLRKAAHPAIWVFAPAPRSEPASCPRVPTSRKMAGLAGVTNLSFRKPFVQVRMPWLVSDVPSLFTSIMGAVLAVGQPCWFPAHGVTITGAVIKHKGHHAPRIGRVPGNVRLLGALPLCKPLCQNFAHPGLLFPTTNPWGAGARRPVHPSQSPYLRSFQIPASGFLEPSRASWASGGRKFGLRRTK